MTKSANFNTQEDDCILLWSYMLVIRDKQCYAINKSAHTTSFFAHLPSLNEREYFHAPPNGLCSFPKKHFAAPRGASVPIRAVYMPRISNHFETFQCLRADPQCFFATPECLFAIPYCLFAIPFYRLAILYGYTTAHNCISASGIRTINTMKFPFYMFTMLDGIKKGFIK